MNTSLMMQSCTILRTLYHLTGILIVILLLFYFELFKKDYSTVRVTTGHIL